MIDITAPRAVEVTVSQDGQTLRVYTDEQGCVLRACRIGVIAIIDNRRKPPRKFQQLNPAKRSFEKR